MSYGLTDPSLQTIKPEQKEWAERMVSAADAVMGVVDPSEEAIVAKIGSLFEL